MYTSQNAKNALLHFKKAQIGHAKKRIETGERPSVVAESMGINRSTLYRALKIHTNETKTKADELVLI